MVVQGRTRRPPGGPNCISSSAGLFIVTGIGCRNLVRVASARCMGRVARGELPRGEVGIRWSDPLLENFDLEAILFVARFHDEPPSKKVMVNRIRLRLAPGCLLNSSGLALPDGNWLRATALVAGFLNSVGRLAGPIRSLLVSALVAGLAFVARLPGIAGGDSPLLQLHDLEALLAPGHQAGGSPPRGRAVTLTHPGAAPTARRPACGRGPAGLVPGH